MAHIEKTIRFPRYVAGLLFLSMIFVNCIGIRTICLANDTDQQIKDLIEALGDTNYTTRQDAEVELRKLGAKALPLLKIASKANDLEIQTRSKQLIVDIEKAIYQAKLDDFEKGNSDSIAHWDRYQKQIGSSKEDRKFFVLLHKAEPDLMRIPPEETKRLSNAFQARMDQIYFEYRTPSKNAFGLQRRNLKELSDENCALLFLSTYQENRYTGYSCRTFSYMCSSLNSKTNLAALMAEPEKQKLFTHWLIHGEMTSIRERLYAAKKLNHENTILKLSSKAIELKNPKSLVMDAITQIVQIKKSNAIPQLLSFLDDRSDVSYYPKSRNRGITLELRDAALIGLLVATNQNPKTDYKFASPSSSRYTGKYVGFSDDKEREKAHAKWKQWWEANESNYKFESSNP